MTTPRLSFWLAQASLLYVALLSVEGSVGPQRWAVLLGLPLLLAEVWRRTAKPRLQVGKSSIALWRSAAWGTGLWLAARASETDSNALDAAANLGAAVTEVASLVAFTRISHSGQLLKIPNQARSLDAAIFATAFWAVATVLPAAAALAPSHLLILDPLAIDYATTTAGIGGLFILSAAAFRLRRLRRLELGIGDRASGALALSLSAILIAVPSALFDVGPPDRVVTAAVLAASLTVMWTATTTEPTSVTGSLRGVLAVTMLGVPTVLVAALFARKLPHQAGIIVLLACSAAIVVGLIAHRVSRVLGPEQSRWLDAIQSATEHALLPEPDEAIRAALAALSKATGQTGVRPELWRADPPEILSTDVAGYLHIAKADSPPSIYEMARGEPERTIRRDVLAAVSVRRPDTRSLLAWFESHQAFSATVIDDDDGPLGFILLPQGGRRAPMTLEEARAVRNLADRLTALLAVSSALARSRRRELSALSRSEKLDDEKRRLEQVIAQSSNKNRFSAEEAKARITKTAHGPASVLALETLEQAGRGDAPCFVVAEPGINVADWCATLHLASPRQDGPYIVLDACAAGGGDRWQDLEHSPLTLATGGTLLIQNAEALTPTAQEFIVQHLARPPVQDDSRLPAAGIILASAHTPEALVERGLLSDLLIYRIANRPLRLPTLSERAEDLRALILDRLARIGLAVLHQPLGVDNLALRALMEHPFPGNELELDALLTNAAHHARPPSITLANLQAAGLVVQVPAPEPPMMSLPTSTRRRRQRRRPIH